ncbi:hypothetical protein GQ43DRAFT_29688 [Delitschia confertaspora ATCC 74209]|uniref:C2H2-type domain-containing protein n=1 Tax=Delitschia confertaspora ATCC 74209 TaxID=1513339 RepID=A0A9P4JNU4_9PLEO|nr:hypothetical protein GQ43DRAFT_29688 [Delitschia confertaspora ATCC 74209]
MNNHLLQYQRKRLKEMSRQEIKNHFERYLATCRWNGCGYRFKLMTAGSYSLHVSRHAEANQIHQCLWNRCSYIAQDLKALSTHLSEAHSVPTEWTIPTRYHFCFEHATWVFSDRVWEDHLEKLHLNTISDYCGIIKQHGLVIVAASCPFCIGNLESSPHIWAAQFDDVFGLHKHIKEHLVTLDFPLSQCPHPLCSDSLENDQAF